MKAKFFYIDFELNSFSLICIYKAEKQSLSEVYYSPKKFKHKKLSKKFMIFLMKVEVNNVHACDSEDMIDNFLKRHFITDKINRKFVGELKI